MSEQLGHSGMERVAILGCSGAGKTTFARRFSELTGLPIIHLDREFWNPGWVASEQEEFRGRIIKLYEADEWIADGNYGSTIPDRLDRADTVFILDYPTRTCLFGLLKRVVTGIGRDRPDCAGGCPERLDWELIRYVLGYRKKNRNMMMNHVEGRPHLTVHVFTCRSEGETFLKEDPACRKFAESPRIVSK